MNTILNPTEKSQMHFGQYIRSGKNPPVTTVSENTHHYRELVYSVIKDTMSNAYPILKNFLNAKEWENAVQYFFEHHKSQTEQIWKLPFEFYEFYLENPFPTKKIIPFLNELMYFEWLEIEVFMMEDLEFLPFSEKGNPKTDVLIPNPEIKILPLQYPIHNKATKKITEKDKGQYFVSLHRDYYDKQVKFNELSLPFVEMLVLLNEQETTFIDLYPILKKYESDSEKISEQILEFIRFALENNLILGYKKTRN